MKTNLVAVYTDDPYHEPYRLYVGPDKSLISDLTLIHNFGEYTEFDPELVVTIEDILLRHGYVVTSKWYDETECWFAYVQHTN
jgi:hypothetical protein